MQWRKKTLNTKNKNKFDYIKLRLGDDYEYESEEEEKNKVTKSPIKRSHLKNQQTLMQMNLMNWLMKMKQTQTVNYLKIF